MAEYRLSHQEDVIWFEQGSGCNAYISPIDGVAVPMPYGSIDKTDSIIFAELEKAGKLIRELRAEVEALKSKVG